MPPKFSRELEKKIIFPEHMADQTRTSPCEANCPAGNPIQKMNALIQEDRIEDALGYLKSRNPFPGITGRVCSHPCENVCNRNEFDEGVAFRHWKDLWPTTPMQPSQNGPKRGSKLAKNWPSSAPGRRV